jgi:hypothetical protein
MENSIMAIWLIFARNLTHSKYHGSSTRRSACGDAFLFRYASMCVIVGYQRWYEAIGLIIEWPVLHAIFSSEESTHTLLSIDASRHP